MEIISRNTNTLAPTAHAKLLRRGATYTSRNGPVLRIFEPVSICLTNPWERVNFSPTRDANPFFHLIEAMAMLAPYNSAPLMTHFASGMMAFSDDGKTYNAFYGTRARLWHYHRDLDDMSSPPMPTLRHLDQLDLVIKELLAKPDSRQCVVQLWDPVDLTKQTKDKACNINLLFDIVPHRYDYQTPEEAHLTAPTSPSEVVRMTTFNRSNDAVLGGISGANVVHLSFFHEYVALGVNRAMGSWWHISNNLHAYADQPQWQRVHTIDDYPNLYNGGKIKHVPLYVVRDLFDSEVNRMMEFAVQTYDSGATLTQADFAEPFLRNTVVPVYNAWQARKSKDEKRMVLMQHWLNKIEAEDWRVACKAWVERRARA